MLVPIALIGCGGPTDLGGSRSFATGGDTQFASSKAATNRTIEAFWNVQALKSAPKAETLGESTEKVGDVEVTLSEVLYESPAAQGGPIRVFAYYGVPVSKKGGKLPAIVLVHGGGGLADRNWVLDWASRGYAALAMDLPGKGGPGREKSRSEGPDMIDDNIFKVSPSPRESYLYAAVNAVCRAVSFLSERKEVDRSRIGVAGFSWGGVITLLANGIDDRIAAACTVFGAGFIPDESCWVQGALKKLSQHEKKVWRENFDPSSYLGSLHARMLFVEATQDAYYPLRSFMRTYEGARCEKSLCLVLNKNHEWDEPTYANIRRWFDWALKSGPPLPSVRVKRTGRDIQVTVKGAEKGLAVMLAGADSTDYGKAVWTTTEMTGKDGVWRAEAPAASKPSFVLVRDKDGGCVAASVQLP